MGGSAFGTEPVDLDALLLFLEQEPSGQYIILFSLSLMQMFCGWLDARARARCLEPQFPAHNAQAPRDSKSRGARSGEGDSAHAREHRLERLINPAEFVGYRTIQHGHTAGSFRSRLLRNCASWSEARREAGRGA